MYTYGEKIVVEGDYGRLEGRIFIAHIPNTDRVLIVTSEDEPDFHRGLSFRVCAVGKHKKSSLNQTQSATCTPGLLSVMQSIDVLSTRTGESMEKHERTRIAINSILDRLGELEDKHKHVK